MPHPPYGVKVAPVNSTLHWPKPKRKANETVPVRVSTPPVLPPITFRHSEANISWPSFTYQALSKPDNRRRNASREQSGAPSPRGPAVKKDQASSEKSSHSRNSSESHGSSGHSLNGHYRKPVRILAALVYTRFLTLRQVRILENSRVR